MSGLTLLLRGAVGAGLVVLVVLVGLAALPAGTAGGQTVSHASPCHPDGSDSYTTGDSIVFDYEPAEPTPPPLPKLPVAPFPPCVDVTLTAEGVTGKPPLRLEWEAPDGRVWSGDTVQLDTGSLPTGVSPLTLTVSNDHGEAVRTVNLWVQHLAGPVPAPEVDEDPSPDLEASFRASAAGAHEWRWAFGDGTSTAWQESCDLSTAVVTHTFPAPGTYAVVAYARNCRDGIVASEPRMVSVGDPDVVEILQFEAVGCSTFCVFETGEEIHFTVETNATPDRYLYDWDGNGTIDQVSTQPLTHRYQAFGVYVPRLVVERGEGQDERVHAGLILVE